MAIDNLRPLSADEAAVELTKLANRFEGAYLVHAGDNDAPAKARYWTVALALDALVREHFPDTRSGAMLAQLGSDDAAR